MKTKFLLPGLAMIFAIGMSFGSVNADYTSATGFIQTAQGWEQVNVDCSAGEDKCRMYFSSNPNEIYTVYDAPGGNPLESADPDPIEVRD